MMDKTREKKTLIGMFGGCGTPLQFLSIATTILLISY